MGVELVRELRKARVEGEATLHFGDCSVRVSPRGVYLVAGAFPSARYDSWAWDGKGEGRYTGTEDELVFRYEGIEVRYCERGATYALWGGRALHVTPGAYVALDYGYTGDTVTLVNAAQVTEEKVREALRLLPPEAFIGPRGWALLEEVAGD